MLLTVVEALITALRMYQAPEITCRIASTLADRHIAFVTRPGSQQKHIGKQVYK